MSVLQPFCPTMAEIETEAEALLRELPDVCGLPKDALHAAAFNRLQTRRKNETRTEVPTRTDGTSSVLKSKRGIEVAEVAEVAEVGEGTDSDRRRTAEATVPVQPVREPDPALVLPDVRLPVARYILAAAAHVDAKDSLGQIYDHQAVFLFVRILKAHPKLSGHSAKVAWASVKQSGCYLEGWCEGGQEDVEAAFYDGWDSARLPAGINPLTEALRRANANPLGLLRSAEESRPPGYSLFVSLAAWLCVVVGSVRIKLPCDAVAAELGVSAMTVSRYRKFALRDGYLSVLKKARHRPGGLGEATTFRFRAEFWEIIQKSLP